MSQSQRNGFSPADFVDGRSLSELLGDAALTRLTTRERTQVWQYFAPLCRPRVMTESEKGIDGRIIDGSAHVWNAEEFAPWVFYSPTTAVCGDLRFEEPKRLDAIVHIAPAARVFVGSLYAGRVRVEGELHVIGTIDVLELDVAGGGYITPSALA